MITALGGFLAWALLLGGRPSVMQRPDIHNNGGLPAVTLTNDRPAASFPINPETLASAPPILRVSITKVVNPGETSFEIVVYLSRSSGEGQRTGEKFLVGNFSLYPSDHPASFTLRASQAFRQLNATGPVSKSTPVRLLLVMKRVRESKPWTPIQITVAPPEWRSG
jgi:hypothetical protein